MSYMWNEISEQPEVLKRCIDTNIDIISQAAEAVRKAGIKQVYIAARGTSDHAAVYGKYVLELVTGLPVALAASSVITLYGGKLKFDKSLVIGISQSGEAADVLEVIREGNRNGTVTLGITNNPDSPIAHESMFHLYCAAGLEKSVAATKTFTSQMLLLALLAARLSGDKEVEGKILQIPEGVYKTLENADIIKDSAERYRFMNECFVLARGMNYAISLEAALKIQETTYVRAKAFAVSDFQHGPIAMIDRNIPVMLIAPEGQSLKDMEEMAARLKANGIELIVISDNNELLGMGETAFPIPHAGSDIVSPFYNAVTAQMFACNLAIAKGLNPDSPRGLKKITVTR